ncbi:MAG: DNA recombination protein RmuC [Bdellovibrionia bacterium]
MDSFISTSIMIGIGWAAFAVLMAAWLRNVYLAKEVLQSDLMETKEKLATAVARTEAFTQGRAQLEQTFKALASETLQNQSESFLKLASERLDKKTAEAKGVLDERAMLFQKLVEPIEKTLTQVQRDMGAFEKNRGEQFGKISEQLRSFAVNTEVWQKEAKSLSQALRRPEVRGSWGELQLRRVVELAGMSAHCDFEEQVTVRTEGGGNLRPDMIVKLPNERILVVDAKAVMAAYLDYAETDDPDKRNEARARHAVNIRTRVRELSLKAYWDQFEGTPEFVILFIPNEAFLEAACETDRSLIEDALKEKIIIATPTTLVALLKAVAYGWQQNQITENAQKVVEAAKELYDRLTPWLSHLDNVGSHLDEAMKSYNSAVGSLDSRVLPSARRLKELGLSQNSIETPNVVSTSKRSVKTVEAPKSEIEV